MNNLNLLDNIINLFMEMGKFIIQIIKIKNKLYESIKVIHTTYFFILYFLFQLLLILSDLLLFLLKSFLLIVF